MSVPHVLLFVISLYLAFVRADYTIDDSNSILEFSENPAGPVWRPFGPNIGGALEIRLPNGTMQTVDATQCYEGTYTYAACSTSNNCAVQFSFTGSGIIIYVLQAGPQGMSASLSIDSGIATTATLAAPPAPRYYVPRVTLFNVQNIPSGTHTAVMTVLDWNGGFSGMMLDYIDVSQAGVAGQATSSDPQPSSPTRVSTVQQTTSQQTSLAGTQANSVTSAAFAPMASLSSGVTGLPSGPLSTNGASLNGASSPTSKKINVAAIVGGVVGLLASLGLGFFFLRRRHRQRLRTLNERPSPFFVPQPDAMFMDFSVSRDPFASSPRLMTSGSSGKSVPLQSWTDSDAQSGFTFDYVARDAINSRHTSVVMSGNDGALSSVPTPLEIVVAGIAALPDRDAVSPTRFAATAALDSFPNEKSWPAPGTNRAADIDVPNAVLTDHQACIVNTLLGNNVPGSIVARVLKGMLTNSDAGFDDPELRQYFDLSVLSWQRTGQGKGMVPSTAPPSYDHAAR